MKSIRIAGVEINLTDSDEGLTLSLFVAGCNLPLCPGCQNPELRDPKSGQKFSTKRLAEFILAKLRPPIKCIALLGGEPTMYAKELVKVITDVKDQWSYPLSVWVYTGKPASDAPLDPLFDIADVMIAGPFKKNLPSSVPFLASSNQVMIDMRTTTKED
jgi:pyruvate-formate lyase-activating enzyme